MWTIKFWKDAAERAGRTFAQVMLAFIVIEGTQVGFEDVEWIRASSVSGLASVASILMSVIGSNVGAPNASFVDTATKADKK